MTKKNHNSILNADNFIVCFRLFVRCFILCVQQKILDHVTDVIYFGALGNCPLCKTGKFIFDGNASYCCNGNVSSYSKCTNKTEIPQRNAVQIPESIRDTHAFMKTKFKTKKRAIKLPTKFIDS